MQLSSITAVDRNDSSNSVTQSGSGTTSISLSRDSATTLAFHLSASLTPNTSDAYSHLLFNVTDAAGNPAGGIPANGQALQPGGADIALSVVPNVSPTWSVNAGVDTNGDGTLERTEITRTITLASSDTHLSQLTGPQPVSSAAGGTTSFSVDPLSYKTGAEVGGQNLSVVGAVPAGITVAAENRAGVTSTTFNVTVAIGTPPGYYKVVIQDDSDSGVAPITFHITVNP